MNESMRIIGKKMGIRMGLMMSFCLSLIGMLASGHFTVPGFIVNFIVSTIISLIIGFFIPAGKISQDFCRSHNLAPGTLKARIVESLISDIIYTPAITLAMTALAYQMAMKQSGGMAQISFIGMYLRSLGVCFVAGFILIFIFMPLFLKDLLKKYGAPGAEEQR